MRGRAIRGRAVMYLHVRRNTSEICPCGKATSSVTDLRRSTGTRQSITQQLPAGPVTCTASGEGLFCASSLQAFCGVAVAGSRWLYGIIHVPPLACINRASSHMIAGSKKATPHRGVSVQTRPRIESEQTSGWLAFSCDAELSSLNYTITSHRIPGV